MRLVQAISMMLAAGLVAAWNVRRRPPSLSAAILSLAQSMDISHLYSRKIPAATGESEAD